LMTLNKNDNSYTLKVEFNYAILVADRSEAGRRPTSSLLVS